MRTLRTLFGYATAFNSRRLIPTRCSTNGVQPNIELLIQ